MRRDLYVIIQLGFAFFTVFSAFNSQGFIEISVLRGISYNDPSSGITEHSGYYSLAIIYLAFTICNIFAPPIISIIGPKWSQVLGAICYTLFMFSFLCLNWWLLYISSALLGFGAAVLWTGNGVYLVKFSREEKMARNSGIIWAMLQTSLIAGAFFLLLILRLGDLISSFRIVYTVFSIMSSIGVAVLICLPSTTSSTVHNDGMEDHLVPVEEESVTNSALREFKRTFSLLMKKEIIALSIPFMYSGIETTFYTGVYSACLSAFTALTNGSEVIIPYAIFSMGIGQTIGGFSFGYYASYNKLFRSHIIVFGTFLHLVAFFLCFLNIPMETPLHKTTAVAYIEPSMMVALVTGLFLGLADSCWNTQIYTLIGILYKNEASSAFAIFKFFQSLSACVSFYYSSSLLLHWQLLILSIGVVSAAVCFISVQMKTGLLENETFQRTRIE